MKWIRKLLSKIRVWWNFRNFDIADKWYWEEEFWKGVTEDEEEAQDE